jgi:hypothetical protein
VLEGDGKEEVTEDVVEEAAEVEDALGVRTLLVFVKEDGMLVELCKLPERSVEAHTAES